MNLKTKKILLILITLTVIILSFSTYFYIKLTSKVNSAEDIELRIENNSSIKQIIAQLNEQNLLKPAYFFEYFAKGYAFLTNKHIFAGVHKFSSNLTNGELIIALFSDKNLLIKRVTFPEGITVKRFASILQKKLQIDSANFVQLCYSKDFIKNLDVDAENLEGYLMPATYDFFVDIEPEKIIKMLVSDQKKILNKYIKQAENIGFNLNEILTLASIIEAETPVISERKTVSGVYHNRLKKKMLLQADPTVQYALEAPKKRLLYSDLAINSKYNTYKYSGLPPGPINSPSNSSIEAAVLPENHNFLFFVAIGDGTNRHNFSENFAKHQKQVAQYRKNRK